MVCRFVAGMELGIDLQGRCEIDYGSELVVG
jgi:hypothetical protein